MLYNVKYVTVTLIYFFYSILSSYCLIFQHYSVQVINFKIIYIKLDFYFDMKKEMCWQRHNFIFLSKLILLLTYLMHLSYTVLAIDGFIRRTPWPKYLIF